MYVAVFGWSAFSCCVSMMAESVAAPMVKAENENVDMKDDDDAPTQKEEIPVGEKSQILVDTWSLPPGCMDTVRVQQAVIVEFEQRVNATGGPSQYLSAMLPTDADKQALLL